MANNLDSVYLLVPLFFPGSTRSDLGNGDGKGGPFRVLCHVQPVSKMPSFLLSCQVIQHKLKVRSYGFLQMSNLTEPSSMPTNHRFLVIMLTSVLIGIMGTLGITRLKTYIGHQPTQFMIVSPNWNPTMRRCLTLHIAGAITKCKVG